jgi:hypothetical protein
LAYNKTINIIRFAHWEKASLALRAKALGFSRYCKRYTKFGTNLKILNNFVFVASLFLCHPLLASSEEWELEVSNTSCYLWKSGTISTTKSESIEFIVSFGLSSQDHKISEDLKLAGFKKQKYTLTITGNLHKDDERGGLHLGNSYHLPMDIVVAGMKLEQYYKIDKVWSYFIQGELVENMIADNLKTESFNFKIRATEKGDYHIATISNLGFSLKSSLLRQCESYFV